MGDDFDGLTSSPRAVAFFAPSALLGAADGLKHSEKSLLENCKTILFAKSFLGIALYALACVVTFTAFIWVSLYYYINIKKNPSAAVKVARALISENGLEKPSKNLPRMRRLNANRSQSGADKGDHATKKPSIPEHTAASAPGNGDEAAENSSDGGETEAATAEKSIASERENTDSAPDSPVERDDSADSQNQDQHGDDSNHAAGDPQQPDEPPPSQTDASDTLDDVLPSPDITSPEPVAANDVQNVLVDDVLSSPDITLLEPVAANDVEDVVVADVDVNLQPPQQQQVEPPPVIVPPRSPSPVTVAPQITASTDDHNAHAQQSKDAGHAAQVPAQQNNPPPVQIAQPQPPAAIDTSSHSGSSHPSPPTSDTEPDPFDFSFPDAIAVDIPIVIDIDPPPSPPRGAKGTCRYSGSSYRGNLLFHFFDRGGAGDCYPHCVAGQLQMFAFDSEKHVDCRKKMFKKAIEVLMRHIDEAQNGYGGGVLPILPATIAAVNDEIAPLGVGLDELYGDANKIGTLFAVLASFGESSVQIDATKLQDTCSELLSLFGMQMDLTGKTVEAAQKLKDAKCAAAACDELLDEIDKLKAMVDNARESIGKLVDAIGASAEDDVLRLMCTELAKRAEDLSERSKSIPAKLKDFIDAADDELKTRESIHENIQTILATMQFALGNGTAVAEEVLDAVSLACVRIADDEAKLGITADGKECFDARVFQVQPGMWQDLISECAGEGFAHSDNRIVRNLSHICEKIAKNGNNIGELQYLTSQTFNVATIHIATNMHGKMQLCTPSQDGKVATISLGDQVMRMPSDDGIPPCDIHFIDSLYEIWQIINPIGDSGEMISFPKFRFLVSDMECRTLDEIGTDESIAGETLEEKIATLEKEIQTAVEFLIAHCCSKLSAVCCYCIDNYHWQQAVIDQESVELALRNFHELMARDSAEVS
ncbi:MAG: hypothetical protein LBB38_01615 [Puniceicoccales bacterium]|nr:hypothetical protein [Puniceicoccales bacterium]